MTTTHNPASKSTIEIPSEVAVGDDILLNAKRVIPAFKYTELTASATVKASSGLVAGYIVTGGAVTTLTLYDNPTSAAGDIIHKAAAVDASATSVIVTFPTPFEFYTGLYASIGGADATVNIIWV